MRVALVMMDPLVVLVLLDSRETVVSLDPAVPWDLLEHLDLLDPLEVLEDLETVERLAPLVPLDLLELLELEALLVLLEPVVRREVLERREREA